VQPAGRPDVDAIFGIPPTVAIEQRTSRGGRKSTVGTLTEVHHFLRLLYVKLGLQHCPDCQVPIEPQSADAIAARLMREAKGRRVGFLAPLVVARKGYYTDLAKWAAGKGYDRLRVDGEYLPTAPWPRLDRFREHTLELPVGEVVVGVKTEGELRRLLQLALDHGKGVAHVIDRGKVRVFSTRRACPSCSRSFAEPDPRLLSYNSKHGWCESCYGTGVAIKGFDAEQTGEEIWWNEWFEGEATPCADCEGQRLNPVALSLLFRDRSIAALAALPVDGARRFFDGLKLAGREREIARDLLAEIRSRLTFLQDVGLGYISLDRAAPTLSGRGAAHPPRRAARLEPAGRVLRARRAHHRPAPARQPCCSTRSRSSARRATRCSWWSTTRTPSGAPTTSSTSGPAPARAAGESWARARIADLIAAPESLTGRFLAHPLRHPLAERRAVRRGEPALEIEQAELHNLRKVNARIPLGRLTVVTGVSGSGKSTLARDVLYSNLRAHTGDAKRRRRSPAWLGCKALHGVEQVARVLEVDQTPIGKTPRSCPATYVGFWDDIRKLYAGTTESRVRGYGPGRFSFNTAGGAATPAKDRACRRSR
jgi:excinuclease ABC subunit A